MLGWIKNSQWIMWLMVASLLGLLGGCGKLMFANDGEFGIKYEHNLMFVHRTSDTKATSTVEWKMPAVEEWIKAKAEPVEP